MLRIQSPLPEATERLTERVIGCAIEVHRALGPGFVEGVYQSAMSVELTRSAIPFECEKLVDVFYRDAKIAAHRIDLIVAGEVLVELKAVTALDQIHAAQITSYLRATGLRVGLLMNFSALTLRAGLRRFVL